MHRMNGIPKTLRGAGSIAGAGPALRMSDDVQDVLADSMKMALKPIVDNNHGLLY